MEFTNIDIDNPKNCSCIENAKEDTVNEYARLFYSPPKNDKDIEFFFKSKWEKLRKKELYPNDEIMQNCSKICGNKGVSVFLWNADTKKQVMEKFRKDFYITRESPNAVCIFRFKQDAGVIKKTGGLAHYDFYKSDEFDITKLEIVRIIPANDLIENDE